MPDRRLFAVIPAAGRSVRMGQPKLLMRLGARTLIARLLAALDHPAVAARIVVVRRSDEDLAAEVVCGGGLAVRPTDDPPHMRQSVEWALDAIRVNDSPQADDGWLLIPADHPVLDARLLAELIERWQASDAAIMVPTFQGRRGHPTFFRWSTAGEVARIPAGAGLNWLLHTARDRVLEVPVDDDSILLDVDTPEDFERLRSRWDNALD